MFRPIPPLIIMSKEGIDGPNIPLITGLHLRLDPVLTLTLTLIIDHLEMSDRAGSASRGWTDAMGR